MKKLIIVFVLLLAVGVSAQDEMIGLTGKGMKVGANLADLSGDISNNTMKFGFAGGGFITYMFSPQFGIQPELMYIMKGTKADVGDAKLKFDYIDLPILLKFAIPTEGNIKPNLFAGPAVGFLLSAKADDEDVKDYLKSINMCVAFGAGVGIQMESMMVTFDARYTLGVTNINDEGEGDLKTRDITFMLGFSF